MLNREDREEKTLAHLAAEQLDSVMNREKVAHHNRLKEVVLDCGYRADLLVDECTLVESKTVDVIYPVPSSPVA
jgi:hypothetical protein